MSMHTVEIKESLVRVVEIEANSKEEALDKVSQMYRDEEIILDDSYFIGHKITYIPQENKGI
ncbi:DpnD/PcfM family protein [Enterococcus faecalis]|uniref:DpnD/PcfM family protein n=1 Tax=Enterococcus faecalis TaxID=1351 RepID=UPI00235FDB64|nr:DpnD/PcfM family protein [Enterococcus faecalis]